MMRVNTTNVLGSVRNGAALINSKVKGTFIEKGAIYLKNIFNDYKEVAIGVRQNIKEKPLKSAYILFGMGLFGYSLTHNPDEQSFRAKFIDCFNDVSLIPPENVNPLAAEHCKLIQKCYSKDLIRYNSLGIFSIIWVDRHSSQCNTFETNCSYLQIPFQNIPNHIIDVGFWNIWWVISRKMLDYDVNY